MLEVVEFMSDGTHIPILLDADTGYGSFNNARRLVRKLEQRGVAAMCIEDKLFPRPTRLSAARPSRWPTSTSSPARSRPAKDTQQDEDFCVVARVEALIAGWGLAEALKRAEAYHEAGADAILMHSKKSTADEILAFMQEWGNRAPVVIVPTMYYSTPVEVFEEAGVSLVIWANHLLRASITIQQQTAAKIFAERSLMSVRGQDRLGERGLPPAGRGRAGGGREVVPAQQERREGVEES